MTGKGDVHKSPHCAIIGNQADTMLRFRGGLIRLLVNRGTRVTVLCPEASPAQRQAFDALGVRHVVVHGISRSGLNPLADLSLMRELYVKLRQLSPTHVLSYFLKPSIYGTLAAVAAAVPRRIAMIEGLGFAFSGSTSRSGRAARLLARNAVVALLRFALPKAHRVVVLNPDDAAFLTAKCRLDPGRLVRIDGIGVDLAEFVASPVPEGPPVFCLAARLIREKGVVEFAEAARRLRAEVPAVHFTILGDVDDSPNSLTTAELEAWVAEGLVSWPGKVADIRPYLKQSSVFVLPSSYGEGLPRSIMEAMAMGRPVVTSTTTGCRESITDGVSGFLVPPRDVAALTNVLRRFIQDKSLASRMGRAAAAEAQRRYDQRKQDGVLANLLSW